jgi:hypothetical protein
MTPSDARSQMRRGFYRIGFLGYVDPCSLSHELCEPCHLSHERCEYASSVTRRRARQRPSGLARGTGAVAMEGAVWVLEHGSGVRLRDVAAVQPLQLLACYIL